MESPLTVSDKTWGTLTFLTDLHRELQHASTDGYCISCAEYQPEASVLVLRFSPKPRRGRNISAPGNARGKRGGNNETKP